MVEPVLTDADTRMKKSIDGAAHEFSTVRTGRANPSLVEGLKVEYYGTTVPLSQVAAVSVPEPRQLEIKPWDKGAIQGIERAIHESKLGLTPMNDGKVIRLNIPALTEERRKDLVKVVKQMAENHRVSVRNVRREAVEQVRELVKSKSLSEDEKKRAEEKIQKLTDAAVTKIDELAAGKEKEILTV